MLLTQKILGIFWVVNTKIDIFPYFDNLTNMITAEQIRMAKAALGWSNTDLGQLSGLHKNTVNNAENGKAKTSTLLLLKMLFEKGNETHYIEFLNEDEHSGPGIRLNKHKTP